jgi:BTB/POZ domain-containing protein KCTD9
VKSLTFATIGLLAILSLDKKFKEKHSKLFENWDKLPTSSQEGWKRLWVVLLGTSICFVLVAGFEQIIKPKTQPTQTTQITQSTQTQAGEDCPPGFSLTGFYCLIIKSELLKLAETFSIVVAAWIFILDRKERQAQANREDWSLIDGARGSETSGARYSAIKRLHQEREELKGLDAESADLQGINLEGANLERSNLHKANLEGAYLLKANLKEANLKEANLKGAKLNEAELRLADLRGANLKEAKLKKANLGTTKMHRTVLIKADLEGADLRGCRFYCTDFRGANLKGADLSTAKFAKVKNLTLEQIKKAKNWDEAEFTVDIFPDNPDIPREKPIVENDESSQILRQMRDLEEIEDLVDEINQIRNLPQEDFNAYVKNISFQIPEVTNLRDRIFSLKDLQDLQEYKKQELADIIEDIHQDLDTLKNKE